MDSSSKDKVRFGALIVEMLAHAPANVIIWRTFSGSYTAGELKEKLQSGHVQAKIWVSEIARHVRRAQAQHAKDMESSIAANDFEAEAVKRLDPSGFIALLKEVPDEAGPVYWHPLEGAFSSSEMQAELIKGGPVADAYLCGYVRTASKMVESLSPSLK